MEFLYESLILRPLNSEIVPIILPDSQTDSLILSAKGIKYFRSVSTYKRFIKKLISSFTFSVKFLNDPEESAFNANLGILKILLSQLMKAELRRKFCFAIITVLFIFFTVKPLDSLNPRL